MSTDTWLPGISGDWNTASDWSLGVAPAAGSAAVIAGAGSYVVTLYGSAAAASLTMAAPGAEFYDAGALALTGTLALQSGTLALAYGAIDGGTLALAGGRFLSNGGTLVGVAVQGTLAMTAPESSLVVTGGLSLAGVGGSGSGSIALTGGYAALDFVGSQSLDHATISIGASGNQPGQTGAATLAIAQAGGASAGATLTLGTGLWLRGTGGLGQVVLGSTSPIGGPGLPDALVNQGTITAGTLGEVLTITGQGSFSNQGTIGVSNGATLVIATAGFTNTGTIAVSNATLSLGGTYSTGLLSALGNITLSAGQVQLAGTATNTGTLGVGTGSRLGATLGVLSLTGTIAGGTVADGGHGISFAAGTGVLDGVIYAGILDLSAGGAVTLTDGARVTAASGSAGSIVDIGSGSALLLCGTETLDNVSVSLGSANTASVIATADPWMASTATTATLGPSASVIQAGANATLQAMGWSSVPGFGQADTLVNQGTITAAFAGGRMILGGYGTILNQGGIAVSGGDTLSVTVAQFTNTGMMTAATGGTLLLGQAAFGFGTPPAWSNAGQITVSGGTLVLGGAFTTAQLGSITQTAGSVVLAGTLSNIGATLALGGHGALTLPALSLSGTIAGGTIVDTAAGLAVGLGSGALLDGVSYRGTLAMTASGAFLRVRDGLAMTGVVDLLGAGAVLDFQGTQVFDRAQVLIGASGIAAAVDVTHDPAQSGGTTLTIGGATSITQSGQLAAIGRNQGTGIAGDMIVNAGTISAGVAGGTLTLGGPGFTNQGSILVGQGETLAVATNNFANTGTIAVNGGLLSVGGSLTLAQLGQVGLANGAISVSGTLDVGGGTLSIGQGNAIARLALTGTLHNGTIVDAGAGLALSAGATLDAVTYDGTLDLSRPFAQLTVAHGITLANVTGTRPGLITLTGAQTRLIAGTTETLDGAQITLGSVAQYYAGQRLAAPVLAAAAGVQLTLGRAATLTLAGTAGTLGDAGSGLWTDGILNQGQILAGTSGGTLNLASTFFTNAGTMTASGGGIVTIGDAGFTNTGLLAVGTGSAAQITLLDYYAAPNAGPAVFSNTGTIALQGGILQELTGNGLFPAVPLANLSGASIVGSGLVFAQIANSGTIEAAGGLLQLNQAVTGNGAVLIDATGTLELASTLPAAQVIRFTGAGGTLKLDTPAAFTGTLSGLGAGDIIDMPSVILTGVGLSGGTLVASTATLNYRFSSTVPLGGEVSAGHDSHGGATIAFLAQTPGTGAPAALIGVTQPSMLFWASPAGDAFTGLAANLNGAHVSNWGAADSLDITDMAPSQASLALVQTTGLDTLTIGDGTHSSSVGLTGTYAAASFHLTSDGHGGTLLTFGH